MEAMGKCKMLCKLLFSVVCFLAIFHLVHSSHVVSFSQKNREVNLDQHSESHEHTRWKRSDETASERKDDKCDSQKDKFRHAIENGKRLETRHVFETETKFSLAMAWASTNDDGVLVVLTTEETDAGDVSTLWRSMDAGRTWANISSKVGDRAFRKEDGLQRNPHHPKWIYLISYEMFMYKSEDGGNTWTKLGLPSQVKNELIFHGDERYKDHVMIITVDRKLVVTEDNFKTHEIIADVRTHTAHWGTEASDSVTSIFMSYDRPGDNVILPFYLDDSVPAYKLRVRSDKGGNWKTIRDNVVDFGIQGDFLYASVYKDDKPKANSKRLLVVSNDAGKNWNEAQLPTLTSDRFFSVLDMSQGLIFMHVDKPGDTGYGTLYTSWSKGIVFSESLQRHLYPNFNSITDFYKVESMQGTYIASQLSEDNSIHSVITFDLGGEWKPLPKPADTPCHSNLETCSLQIHNSYSLHRMVNAHPPMSVKDAVGLIIVNAHAAANLQITDPDVFVSSDGGYSWRKALDGPHSYIIADSGGLIVAVSLSTPTPQELKFSTDEGRCWHVYKFTNETVHHTGLLTEPGGKSMTVALWGYRVKDKKWTVYVIDFADVITDHCQSSDYEPWMPHEAMKKEDASRQGCLLGARMKYQRLKHDSWCRNGYEYKPDKSKTTCTCSKEDFECDYGYFRPHNQDNCVKQGNFNGPEIDICFRGHEQEVISEGYRKLPGDVCTEQNGFSPRTRYINLTKVCTERIRLPPIAVDNGGEEHIKQRNVLIVGLVAIILVIAGLGLSYCAYKIVVLRRHKVVYRYSMLNQNDAKDFDEEIERTLTGSSSHPHPMFGDSDEEELPAEPPQRQNGQVRKSARGVTGYHDDSDDDMLN